MTEITLYANKNMPDELKELVLRCYKKNPDKKDLKALRKWAAQQPEVFDHIAHLATVTTKSLLDQVGSEGGAVGISFNANVETLKRGLSYDDSPALERALIDTVVLNWVRLFYLETQLTNTMHGQHNMREGAYWTRLVDAAHSRFLRSCETLAKVRKITRATLQINIAEAGSQVMNFAGDLNRKTD
jgi:hypothetical protein